MSNAVRFINDAALAKPNGFNHVTVVPGNELIYIAGQVSYDSAGNIVGIGDLAAQTRQTFINIGRALESAGSDFSHVVKMNFFVKNLSEANVAIIRAVRKDFLDADRLPASTMVGVAALGKDNLLLEIEAVAVPKG